MNCLGQSPAVQVANGCHATPSAVTGTNSSSSADDEYISRVRDAQSQQASNWTRLLALGQSSGWNPEDMAALTLLQQNAQEGSNVYSLDQLNDFEASTCTHSALSAADRIERVLFEMERDSQRAQLPKDYTEEDRTKALRSLQSNAAYLTLLPPMCEKVEAKQEQAQASSEMELQLMNESAQEEADREVQQRALLQSNINVAIALAAQQRAAQNAAQADALDRLQQQQQNFQLQQQIRLLNSNPWPITYPTPKAMGITGPLQ